MILPSPSRSPPYQVVTDLSTRKANRITTNSYGSSWAESHAIVVDAQASTAPTTNTINLGQTTTDSLAMYIVAGVIAIIIAIAIIGVLLLKKK